MLDRPLRNNIGHDFPKFDCSCVPFGVLGLNIRARLLHERPNLRYSMQCGKYLRYNDERCLKSYRVLRDSCWRNKIKFWTFFPLYTNSEYCSFSGCYAVAKVFRIAQQQLNEQYFLLVYCEKNVRRLILSNFCIVYIVEISIFQVVAREKHWLLGTHITVLIQRIAQDKASLDPYSYKYQNMLRPLKLTLPYNRFSTNATVLLVSNCIPGLHQRPSNKGI